MANEGVRHSEKRAFGQSLWHKGLRAENRGSMESNRCPPYGCRWPANKTESTCRKAFVSRLSGRLPAHAYGE